MHVLKCLDVKQFDISSGGAGCEKMSIGVETSTCQICEMSVSLKHRITMRLLTSVSELLCNGLGGLQVVENKALVCADRCENISTWMHGKCDGCSSVFRKVRQLVAIVEDLDRSR